METLYKMAGMYNRVGKEWTMRLNILKPGLMPFNDGMFNIDEGRATPTS